MALNWVRCAWTLVMEMSGAANAAADAAIGRVTVVAVGGVAVAGWATSGTVIPANTASAIPALSVLPLMGAPRGWRDTRDTYRYLFLEHRSFVPNRRRFDCGYRRQHR